MGHDSLGGKCLGGCAVHQVEKGDHDDAAANAGQRRNDPDQQAYSECPQNLNGQSVSSVAGWLRRGT